MPCTVDGLIKHNGESIGVKGEVAGMIAYRLSTSAFSGVAYTIFRDRRCVKRSDFEFFSERQTVKQSSLEFFRASSPPSSRIPVYRSYPWRRRSASLWHNTEHSGGRHTVGQFPQGGDERDFDPQIDRAPRTMSISQAVQN
jgi:hypothetical protein